MPKARRSPRSTRRPTARTPRTVPRASGVEDAHFITIDLEVKSRRSLAPLLSTWPRAYQPLNLKGGPDSRWLILNALVADTAEAAAKYLLEHVAKLRGNALLSWRQAYRRRFDIGVQAGGPGRAFEGVQLTSDTLRRIAAAGAHIQLTIYPAEPESQDVPGSGNRAPRSRGSRG